MSTVDYWHGRSRKWNSWTNLDKFLYGAVYRVRNEYRLKIEGIDRYMRILDMHTLMMPSHVHIAPYLKDVDRPYLAHTSAHHWSVHSSWPKANVLRVRQLCCQRSTFVAARTRLLERYHLANVLPMAIGSSILPYLSDGPKLSGLGHTGSTEPIEKPTALWGLLRYHPALQHRQLAADIRAVVQLWQRNLTIGFAYTNAGPNVMARFLALNIAHLGGERGRLEGTSSPT